MQTGALIDQLLDVMARLRAPGGCPWDREQDHKSIRMHAIEEIYELIDAIEAGDDAEMAEELGDLLLQVVFHCQMAKERGAFDFDRVTQLITEKLIRRHPHVFGDTTVKNVDEVWANWEQIKKAEKKGGANERHSALDGIPRHLPALMRAEKLAKKARKAKLLTEENPRNISQEQLAAELFKLASEAQQNGWSPEALLRGEIAKREKTFRKIEAATAQPPR
jgi:uncharacterized protein YabN with tetrapyrrole methylase and pyrophosphatase domain